MARSTMSRADPFPMSNRILYMTMHNPCGRRYGAQFRALHVGRALSRVGTVTLVLVSAAEVSSGEIDAAGQEFDDVTPCRAGRAMGPAGQWPRRLSG